MSGQRTPRIAALLSAIAQAGTLTSEGVAQALEWDAAVAQKTLANAKQLGYVEFTGERVPGELRNYVLTEVGRKKIAGDGAAGASDDDLCERAAMLILASPAGMDSDALADALGVPSFDVERALMGSRQRFVTCNVYRNGDSFVMYRVSASPTASNDWARTWKTSGAPAAPSAQEVLPPKSNMQHLGTTPGGTPVYEIDIEAVHRKQRAAQPEAPAVDLESVTQSSGGEVEDPGCEEYFCLFSTGELLVNRTSGQQVQFTPDETRALFQWLDRLGGTDLSRLAAAEEEAAA